MSSPPYVEHIRNIDEATNKVSNSPARKRSRRLDPPQHFGSTLAPPQFPSRRKTSVASRSVSFNMQHPAMTAY